VSAEATARSSVGSVVLTVAGVAAVLYVPYFIPQAPSASDSYLFGFNNRAAVLLLVLLCACGALWKRGCGLTLLPAGKPAKVSRLVLGVCLAIQLAACLTMVGLVGRSGGFAESHYEIDRVWLLAQGKAPYVGFEWPFGVLFLYGPLGISHALRIGLTSAYYVFWTAAAAAGVVILFATINRLDYPTERKRAIFLLLFLAFLPAALGMGTHYTWLRFMTPLYCMLVVHGVSRQADMERRWQAAALAVGLTAMLLVISPEMAVALGFACCVLLFPRRREASASALPVGAYAGMVAALAAVFAAALRLHVLDTLRASGGGADSFPIPLSVPVVFFFAVVFVCACALVRRWQTPAVNDNSVCLVVVAMPLLAAALGRCDPGHLVCNGAGLLLAVFLYASGSERWWRVYRNGFVVALIAIPLCVQVRLVLPGVRAAAIRTRATAAPEAIDFAAVYPGVDLAGAGGVLEAPFGYTPNGTGTYHAATVDYGFYEGIENANTPRAVERKIEELAEHPERNLLLPSGAERYCDADAEVQHQLMTALFFFPYTAQAVHPVGVREPLCAYIASHYAVVRGATAADFGYALWAPARSAGGR